MKDKVQKIREEVARIQLYTQSEVLKQVLDYIDKVQEEPVSMWHDVSEEPKSNMELICVGQYGNPLVLSSNSDSFKSRDISKWAYFNDLLNLSNAQRTTKNWKELVSEDLEEASRNYADDEEYGDDVYFSIKASFKAGAKWQKQQMMKDALKAVISQVPCSNEIIFYNPASVYKYCLPQEMNKRGLNKGDKVKLIIIKED